MLSVVALGTVVLPAFVVASVIVSSAPSASKYVGYPNSIAVLGHSGATGESPNPQLSGVEVRANSWATGTNPKVNSVYRRILALNPAIQGRNYNLAKGGATVQQLVEQARTAVTQYNPPPDLILIQIMDNDIVCPASTHAVSAFGATFVSALGVLAIGAPDSSFFVVSQFGSPGTWVRSLRRAERLTIAGTGPCDPVDPSGQIAPKKVARLDRVIHRYEAQLKAGCEQFTQCRYDGGAFGAVVDRREYVAAHDINHFSIKGHAKAAAVACAAMKRAGLVSPIGFRRRFR